MSDKCFYTNLCLVFTSQTPVWDCYFYTYFCRGIYTPNANVRQLFLYELLSWYLQAKHQYETVISKWTFVVVFTRSTLVWN